MTVVDNLAVLDVRAHVKCCEMDPKSVIKQKLQRIESYNPKHRSALEQHVLWQINNNEYDFEANLALIRLYQFYPEQYNPEFTKLVLLKTLESLNLTDFFLCKYLIQLDNLAKEPVAAVVELGLLLETCRFPEFWMKLKENPKLTAVIPGFQDSIRKFIIQIISQTYQRIDRSLLTSFLNVNESELKKLIQQQPGWSEQPDQNSLILVNNHEENVKSIKIRERVNFDAITSMSDAFRPSKSDFFIKTGS